MKTVSAFTYFKATRGYLEKHGKPQALCSDKASVFRINNKNASGGNGYTQFGRAMHELNIQTICVNTSSAKGRVERAHLTIQDRLVKELRLYKAYDRLQGIDLDAMVDNKRLGRTLEFFKQVQGKRDNYRSQALPAGERPSRRRRKPADKDPSVHSTATICWKR